MQLIAPWFQDLLERGGRLRVVVGDYMDVTEPAALHRLAVMGFNPARNGHGGWFDFVRDMDDPVDGRALVTVANLLRRVERDRSFTPPALEALLHLRNGTLTPDDGRAFWAFEPLLSASGDRLRLTRPNPDGQAAAMLVELAEWRLGTMPDHEADDPAADFTAAGPDLWRQYLREAIPPLFGPRFSPGNWNAGIVRLDSTLILLTTLKKGGLTAGSHYEDHFRGPDRMQWQSQTRRDSQIGRMLSGADDQARIHLFVRNGKLRNGKAAPFLYCGQPKFVGWEGEGPITVT